MLKVLFSRAQQGHRTSAFPDAPPVMPDRFRGAPSLSPENQARGNFIIVVAQGVFVVVGLSVLFDRVVERPLASLRSTLYLRRLEELGLDPRDKPV